MPGWTNGRNNKRARIKPGCLGVPCGVGQGSSTVSKYLRKMADGLGCRIECRLRLRLRRRRRVRVTDALPILLGRPQVSTRLSPN